MSWLFDNKQQHTTHRKFRTITDGQKSAFTPLGKFKKKNFFFSATAYRKICMAVLWK